MAICKNSVSTELQQRILGRIDNIMNPGRPQNCSHVPAVFYLLIWFTSWMGCGTPASPEVEESGESRGYSERLKATAEEFRYHQILEENLREEYWEKSGVRLRVPKPFRAVATPSWENIAEAHEESRQLLGVPLPGVLGMWKAEFPETSGQQTRTGYLFVLSNHHLLERFPRYAETFHQTLIEDVLVELPGRSHLPIDAEWSSHNWAGYGLPYTSASFAAELADSKSPVQFRIYLMHHGTNKRRDRIKVAMVFVMPAGIELSGSRPDIDPLELSAETLQIQLENKEDS